MSLGPDPLPLPRDVPVGHNCDEDQVHWVRLQCAHVAFELSFVVRGLPQPESAPSSQNSRTLSTTFVACLLSTHHRHRAMLSDCYSIAPVCAKLYRQGREKLRLHVDIASVG